MFDGLTINKSNEDEPESPTEAIAGARKDDSGKSPVVRGAIGYFPEAIKAVAAVSAFGATKYAWNGWRSVPDGLNRYTDAMGRHLIDEAAGKILDDDSGLLSAAHTAWNALARLELIIEAAKQ